MFKAMFGFFLFRFILWNILFCEASNPAIIRYIFDYEKNDYFSYMDNATCGQNNDERDSWCKGKNAWIVNNDGLSNLRIEHMCTCQCRPSNETFLVEKGECVNLLYLENHASFGNGSYFFSENPINLLLEEGGNNKLQTSKKCNKCMVKKVMYFMKSVWYGIPRVDRWKISKNGDLTWPKIDLKNASGKILKIQLKNCVNNKDVVCSEWTTRDLFCKSVGKYVIDVPTFPPPTVASATILPSMDSTDKPTSTFTFSISNVTPTPTALKASTQHVQVSSEFVTSPQVSPTKAVRASSYVCSSDKTICSSSSSAAVVLPTMHPTKSNSDRRSSSSSSSIWTITAVVVACIVVVGVVALLVILRRCNSWVRARSSGNMAKTPVPDSTGNPMYGHNQGEVIALPNRASLPHPQKVEDEEYNYATVDGGHSDPQKISKLPIYQSLLKENVRDSVYTPLNKEPTETPVDYSYNHLQHLQYNPPRSKSDPLYSTLQPPNNDEYMEPEIQISNNQQGGPEPVYNVLEGPDANSAPQDNDPVYNVLEDPNASQYPQDNDPVYNILEDPDDDYDNAPINDENLPASGQDNAAYSSTIDLRKVHSPSSPDYDILEGPEGTLQDSTYQPLGVRVQDDMYQPLDRTSQPIYHSLEPNDSMA